jgi:hypothetical protein
MAKSTRKNSGRPQLTEAEKAARKEALKSETKEAKFIRLGKPRVNKALAAIRQIGNLSGAGYSYTPDQVVKMRTVIGEAVSDAFDKFSKGPAKDKQSFDF